MDKILSISTRMQRVRMTRHFGQVSAIRAGLIWAEGLSWHGFALEDDVVAQQGGL